MRIALATMLTFTALVLAGPARAQFTPQRLVGTGSLSCLHVPSCAGVPCMSTRDTCTMLTSTGGTASGPLCVAPGSVYCCSDVVDCPLLPTAPGSSIACETISGSGTSGGDINLCTYAPICLGVGPASDSEHFKHCFDATQCGTGTLPFVLGPWSLGDCDCDGVPNGLEPTGDPVGDHCVCDATVTCAVLDAGVPDAGTLDASVLDLGGADGGNGTDLGVDAGDVPFDAGSVSMDATAVPPGTSFRGGGGCVCGVASRGASLPAGAFALLLGLVLGRRLRRRPA